MGVTYLGDFAEDETVYIPFNTFDSNDPTASVTVSTLIASDIYVHKDGSLTDIVTDGATIVIDFDSITGNHMVEIDTSAHADYTTGAEYAVRIEGATVDGGNINAWVGSFSIERAGGAIALLKAGTVKVDVETIKTQAVTAAAGVTINPSVGAATIVPTNTQFEARTIVSADYVVVGDTIAGVTLVDTVTDVTNQVTADTTAISGDSTAADNLEATFDGTGYVADTAPSTQAQLSNIANVGSAVNKAASSYTLTTGTQSANTVADTAALNGTRHTHTDDTAEMDLYYEMLIGSGTPSSVTVTGKLTGGNDNLKVLGYDWAATAWVQIGMLDGKNSSVNEVNAFDLYATMVGTGSDLGKVRIRFWDDDYDLSSATLYIDQIFVSYSQGTGDYAMGAIWVNTSASNENTVPGVDGVSTNPVSTWAAALTLSAATNLKEFHIASGSSITLSGNSDNFILHGDNYALALNGQSTVGAVFSRATVSGIQTGAAHFVQCIMTTVSWNGGTIHESALTGDITLTGATTYFLDMCYSGVAGTSTPSIDFGGSVNATNLNFRHYSGGIEIENMGDGTGVDRMSLEGDGQLKINANCNPANSPVIAIRGSFTVTDSVAGGFVSGGGTISDDARYDVGQILDAVTDDATKIDASSVNAVEAKVDTIDGIVDAILVDTDTTIPGLIAALNDLAAGDIWDLASALTLDFGTLMERLYQLVQNRETITDATGAATLRNIGNSANLATWSITDDDTTTLRTEASWV